jgi:hypothetical protein
MYIHNCTLQEETNYSDSDETAEKKKKKKKKKKEDKTDTQVCMSVRICMPSATHLHALNTLQILLRWKHCESPCSLASVVADLTGYQPRGRTRYIRLQ